MSAVLVSSVTSTLGWITASTFDTSRSTQPGRPCVGMHNEYQPMYGDALQLGSKGRYARVWRQAK